MPYYANFADFQVAAENLYSSNPSGVKKDNLFDFNVHFHKQKNNDQKTN